LKWQLQYLTQNLIDRKALEGQKVLLFLGTAGQQVQGELTDSNPTQGWQMNCGIHTPRQLRAECFP